MEMENGVPATVANTSEISRMDISTGLGDTRGLMGLNLMGVLTQIALRVEHSLMQMGRNTT